MSPFSTTSLNGLYKCEFGTPLGQGIGVVSIIDGKIRGGDFSLFYVGEAVIDDGKVKATFETAVHTKVEGVTSVFGVDSVVVDVIGGVENGKLVLRGRPRGAMNVPFVVQLEKIAA